MKYSTRILCNREILAFNDWNTIRKEFNKAFKRLQDKDKRLGEIFNLDTLTITKEKGGVFRISVCDKDEDRQVYKIVVPKIMELTPSAKYQEGKE